jgi:hypothetical protein
MTTNANRTLNAAIEELLCNIDEIVTEVIHATDVYFSAGVVRDCVPMSPMFYASMDRVCNLFEDEIHPAIYCDEMKADADSFKSARQWKSGTQQFLEDLRVNAPCGYLPIFGEMCLHPMYCEFITCQKTAGIY